MILMIRKSKWSSNPSNIETAFSMHYAFMQHSHLVVFGLLSLGSRPINPYSGKYRRSIWFRTSTCILLLIHNLIHNFIRFCRKKKPLGKLYRQGGRGKAVHVFFLRTPEKTYSAATSDVRRLYAQIPPLCRPSQIFHLWHVQMLVDDGKKTNFPVCGPNGHMREPMDASRREDQFTYIITPLIIHTLRVRKMHVTVGRGGVGGCLTPWQ